MNQPSGGEDPNLTGLATACLIVGFCIGLGLGVAALTTYVDTQDKRGG